MTERVEEDGGESCRISFPNVCRMPRALPVLREIDEANQEDVYRPL